MVEELRTTESVVSAQPNRLKELRERRGLTQKEVAKLIDIDHTTVSKHESGTRNFTNEEIKKYARVLRVESYEIFFGPET